MVFLNSSVYLAGLFLLVMWTLFLLFLLSAFSGYIQLEIAVNNSQVFYILGDFDVKTFYKKILKDMKSLTQNAKEVQEAITESEEQ